MHFMMSVFGGIYYIYRDVGLLVESDVLARVTAEHFFQEKILTELHVV
jgi:hypothetical protein